LMFVDLFVRIQPLLATQPFNPARVPYPATIGRDSKIVRVGMSNTRDRDNWILGYLNLYQRRFDTATASPVIAQRYADVMRSVSLPVMNELSAGYVFAPRALAAFQPLIARPGLVVHRNARALPLAYFQDSAGRIRSVISLAFTPSSVFIDVDAPSAGDLILTQQMSSGWNVEIDGTRAVAHESALFRTVSIGAGRHAVKWIYRPASLLAGAILTIIALVRLLFSRWFVKRSTRENFLRESARNA
jgi:hypothetical protein